MHPNRGPAGRLKAAWLAGLTLALSPIEPATAVPLTVTVSDRDGRPLPNVAVYLSREQPAQAGPAGVAIMDQIDLQFSPRFLIVRLGAVVEFPNSDTVSHHVYSFSRPNGFELPLYKGEAHNPVAFKHPGVIVLGCNIHDHMIGYILVIDTPHFALTDAAGTAIIEQLPPGEYAVSAWSPRLADTQPATLGSLTVTGSTKSLSVRLDGKLVPASSSTAASLRWGEY